MRIVTAGSEEAAAFLSRLRDRARGPGHEVEAAVRDILEDVPAARRCRPVRADGAAGRYPARPGDDPGVGG